MVTCAEIVRNTLPDNTGEDSVGMLPLFCQAGLSGRKKRGASLNQDIPVEDAVAAVLAYNCPPVVISMQPEELTHCANGCAGKVDISLSKLTRLSSNRWKPICCQLVPNWKTLIL